VSQYILLSCWCIISILASHFYNRVPISYWCPTFIATSKFNFEMTLLAQPSFVYLKGVSAYIWNFLTSLIVAKVALSKNIPCVLTRIAQHCFVCNHERCDSVTIARRWTSSYFASERCLIWKELRPDLLWLVLST